MTAAVHPGENTLTVQVYRFSSGSWLEDQDFWRMSGLFRSVELFTKPELHLEDVFVKQDFAPDFSSATVTFECKVSGAGRVSVRSMGRSSPRGGRACRIRQRRGVRQGRSRVNWLCK